MHILNVILYETKMFAIFLSLDEVIFKGLCPFFLTIQKKEWNISNKWVSK